MIYEYADDCTQHPMQKVTNAQTKQTEDWGQKLEGRKLLLHLLLKYFHCSTPHLHSSLAIVVWREGSVSQVHGFALKVNGWSWCSGRNCVEVLLPVMMDKYEVERLRFSIIELENEHKDTKRSRNTGRTLIFLRRRLSTAARRFCSRRLCRASDISLVAVAAAPTLLFFEGGGADEVMVGEIA